MDNQLLSTLKKLRMSGLASTLEIRLSIATKNQPFSQVGWGGCDSLIATISLSD